MFEGVIQLAKRLDSLAPDHPWAPAWEQYADNPRPPNLVDLPAGVGFWRAMEWHPQRPEDYPPDPGRFWEHQDPTWLNPQLLELPSAYGPKVIPVAHVAAIRALELDARAWERHADKEISPKTLAHEARRARKWAGQHRELAAQIEFALQRFGDGWKSGIDDLAPTNQPKKPARPSRRVVSLR